MIRVPGANAFIVSHLIQGLNKQGARNVSAAESLTANSKLRNPAARQIADNLDMGDLMHQVETSRISPRPRLRGIKGDDLKSLNGTAV